MAMEAEPTACQDASEHRPAGASFNARWVNSPSTRRGTEAFHVGFCEAASPVKHCFRFIGSITQYRLAGDLISTERPVQAPRTHAGTFANLARGKRESPSCS